MNMHIGRFKKKISDVQKKMDELPDDTDNTYTYDNVSEKEISEQEVIDESTSQILPYNATQSIVSKEEDNRMLADNTSLVGSASASPA